GGWNRPMPSTTLAAKPLPLMVSVSPGRRVDGVTVAGDAVSLPTQDAWAVAGPADITTTPNAASASAADAASTRLITVPRSPWFTFAHNLCRCGAPCRDGRQCDRAPAVAGALSNRN